MPDRILTGISSRVVRALMACAFVSACGVGTQDRPVPLEVDPPGESRLDSPRPGGRALTVYLIRDGRLTPVTRSSADTTVPSALAFLSQGPNSEEVRAGLQTALIPQSLSPGQVDGSGTMTITVTRSYTSVSGDSQLLASAQLVWTATEHDSVDRLRIRVGGEHIAIPTDEGLSAGPVSRRDFRSVAPEA